MNKFLLQQSEVNQKEMKYENYTSRLPFSQSKSLLWQLGEDSQNPSYNNVLHATNWVTHSMTVLVVTDKVEMTFAVMRAIA